MFNGHGLEPVSIEHHIGHFLSRRGVHDCDQAVRCMSFTAAIHYVQVLRGGIVGYGIRVNRLGDTPNQVVGIVFQYFDLRGLAIYNKESIQLRKNKNVVRLFEIGDGAANGPANRLRNEGLRFS